MTINNKIVAVVWYLKVAYYLSSLLLDLHIVESFYLHFSFTGIKGGLSRLSVGIEYGEDLLADLIQAFDHLIKRLKIISDYYN